MIKTTEQFKQALRSLNCEQQRQLSVWFIEQVLDLTQDGQLIDIVARLKNNPSPESLAEMHEMARISIVNTHCPCGEECDWIQQAAYFVARAVAVATETDPSCWQKEGLAWRVAGNVRMARICASIQNQNAQSGEIELKKQFELADRFIHSI